MRTTYARELKEKGFPQPEIQEGQVWQSDLGHAHRIHRSPFGWVTEQISERGGVRFRLFSGQITEGMAYRPTADEEYDWYMRDCNYTYFQSLKKINNEQE